MDVTSEIAEAIGDLQLKIGRAAELARRPTKDVTLVAVSKQQPADKRQAALDAGQRVFGENRVQEAQNHWQELRQHYPDLCLHLIGPLQSNKAADAVALFDVIETIDRPKIAKAIAAEMQRQDRTPTALIQVNTGLEPQKSGIAPVEIGGFLAFCQEEAGLPISGLMCIPPADDEPAPHFALLKKYGAQFNLPVLSMGMSADFETAVQLGATHVRVGSGLFGSRLPRH